jgi:hypothetical protein
MFSLALLTALALPGAEPAAPGGMAPEQALAVIDAKGKLTITHVSCNCFGPAVQENTLALPAKGDEKAPAKVKVKVSTVTLTTAELDAKHVEAYTVDGKAIPAEKLTQMLAKEKTVLVTMDGKKLDPFYTQLYKDDTIVLVPPANTLNAGGGAWGAGPGYGVVPVPAPFPDAPPTPPEVPEKPRVEKREPPREERKP